LTQIAYQATRQRLGALDCIVIGPTDASVKVGAMGVFCHGFGASGEDLVGLASEFLQIADTAHGLGMVFPAAPHSLDDQGMPGGRAWWLMSVQRLMNALEEGQFEQVREEVPEGIDATRAQLTETIQLALQQWDLDSTRLLLGGFSQGAMLCVETALRGLQQPPSKLCLYSGALICERVWKPNLPKLKHTDILQSHGRSDPILPLQTGVWLRDFLREAGCDVDFIEFNGPHTIPYEAIERTAHMLATLANAAV
jgi:phospholipase/carboxylesterase